MNQLKQWLAHPLTCGLNLDDPETTRLRRRIITGKPFLRRVYQEWYSSITRALPDGTGPVLELGSGAGFLSDTIPDLITSEIFYCDGIRAVLDGHLLPFPDASLKAIVMTDVLHHLPAPRRFFSEAARCVQTGGTLVMIEPWVTSWSKLIYNRFHHEPFRPDAANWEFPSSGALSGANGALPWILFKRDRQIFQREFPQWQIEVIDPIMPFLYLVSTGVSMRSLMPESFFKPWQMLEKIVSPWKDNLAMFAFILLRRTA